MLKTLIFSSLFFVALSAHSQDLIEIRKRYPAAVKSETELLPLEAELSSKTIQDDAVLRAYLGAVKTLKAKNAKKAKVKKEFFAEGTTLIEQAVESEPKNIEIRYIRLSVQENAPKFLKYHHAITDDKDYILENFDLIHSKSLRNTLMEFVKESKSFDAAEKQSIH